MQRKSTIRKNSRKDNRKIKGYGGNCKDEERGKRKGRGTIV